jgi:type IV pilus assembly protein PilE
MRTNPGQERRARRQRSPPAARRRIAGVTLIELMLVVVIVGILAVIAVPSYRQYAMRSQRTEAKTALLTLATNQERWYLQNNTFSANLPDVGLPPSGATENAVYTVTIDFADTLTWQATAVPTLGGGTNGVTQVDDTDCQSFTIDAQGVRTAAPDPAGNCW